MASKTPTNAKTKMPESEAEVVERDPVSGLDPDSHTVDTFMYTPLLPPVSESISYLQLA